MAMAWCKATGIFDKMMRDIVAQKEPDVTEENVVLEVYHLGTAFFLLGAGLVLSSIAYCKSIMGQGKNNTV